MNPDQTAHFKLICGFIIVFEIICYVKVQKQTLTREQKKSIRFGTSLLGKFNLQAQKIE